MPNQIKAIILGASGMVGEGVLLTALADERVESVLVLGRRTCGVTHPKLKELLHDNFHDISALEGKLKGYNACYFCLGVTSVGKTEQEYRRTTYDLTLHVAETLSRLNPGMTFCYVSGTGTDSTEKGRFMWARVKGKTENDLQKLPFKGAFMFRPGLIRPVEGQKNLKPIMKFAARLYPLMRLLTPGSVCTLDDLGRSMLNVTLHGYEKKVLENRDIAELGKR